MNREESVNKTLKIFAKDFDKSGRVIIEPTRFHDIIKGAFLAGLYDGFDTAESRASGENYLIIEPMDREYKELSWECFLGESEEAHE